MRMFIHFAASGHFYSMCITDSRTSVPDIQRLLVNYWGLFCLSLFRNPPSQKTPNKCSGQGRLNTTQVQTSSLLFF